MVVEFSAVPLQEQLYCDMSAVELMEFIVDIILMFVNR